MKKPCACGCGKLVNGTYALGHHWKVKAINAITEPPNPSGLCMCGCGRMTAIARVTVHSKVSLKGHHMRYCAHHGYSKGHKMPVPNPSGDCMCGCGRKTSLAKYTSVEKGCVKGQRLRYIHNHHQECYEPETSYKIEDRGFETPCWVWQRWRNKKGGYGFFTRKKKVILAHRYFYAKYCGPITPGLEVHHRCHVTSCVNPDHLQAVTKLVNLRAKKLMKLSMEKAKVIRHLYDWGADVSAIARVFKVRNSTILAVVSQKIWNEGAV